MRVLFVSGIDGFCHRYQVLHRAAQVRSLGGTATVRHFADPRVAGELAAHDVVFLYRVPATAAVGSLQERARARAVPVLGAIDDLIFVDHPDWLPDLDGLDPAEREQWRAGVRRYRATLERCDAFVAPTEPLVEGARELGWEAHLHRNAVSPAELALADQARAATRPREPGIVLGYFSGTPSHDSDLASIARPLAAVLSENASVRLLLVGPVALPPALEPFSARIVREPLVPWHELPGVMARADVSVAPLALERRFAAAKGEIKFLEAAALGIPTVASPTAAYRHAIADGVSGRLASGDEAWRAALQELTGSPVLRARLGGAARADLERRYGEGVRAAELLEVVDRVRQRVRRRAKSTPAATSGAAFDAERPARVALEADGLPAFPEGRPEAISPPLADGSRLVQPFRAAAAGLARVDLHTVTYGQPLDHRLTLTLRREDGSIVAGASLAACEAPDRAWLALELERPEAASCGRLYRIEIAAEGAGAGNAVSFGATQSFVADEEPTGVLGPATLDGEPLAVALVLRGFAAWSHALADAERRARRAGTPRAEHGAAAPASAGVSRRALRAAGVSPR